MADLRFYSWPIQCTIGVLGVIISIYFVEIRQLVHLERESIVLLFIFLVMLFALRKRNGSRCRARGAKR